MFSGFFDKVVAVTVCIALVCAPLPVSRAATDERSRRASDATSAQPPVLTPPSSTFLRDAVPASGFAVEPEDTTDDYFLPEEKDTGQLVWEIAAWVVGAAIVAYFIIKVFIEEDEPEPTEDDGGKDVPS
jgi:hypothetical protein